MNADGTPPDPGSVVSAADFSRELTRARMAAALTIRDIARGCRLPISTVGDYFSGRHLPSKTASHTLVSILAACGITESSQVKGWISALDRARRIHAQLNGAPQPETTVLPAQVVEDLPEASLCPDPREAEDPAKFVETLRQYRVWAGEPSFRDMERRCDGAVAASTMCKILNRAKLPTLPQVMAIVVSCRGTDEHIQAFVSAWRRLRLPAPAPSTPNLRVVPPPSKQADLSDGHAADRGAVLDAGYP